MAAPGPKMQKLKARITRTKSQVSSTAKAVSAPIKQEARVIGRAVGGYGSNKQEKDNTLKYDRVQMNISSRKADRAKRIMERNEGGSTKRRSSSTAASGLTFNNRGESIALPKSKRKAVRVINESMTTKLEGRERKKLAKEKYAMIAGKPKTMEEMRKQNKKKSKTASKCIPGGKGNNLCSPQGRNNDGGF